MICTFTRKDGTTIVNIESNLVKNALASAVADNVNMSGLHISNADLSNVDLSGGNFSGACFKNCDLRSSTLDGCNLSNASFPDSVIIYTSFAGATLTNTKYTGGIGFSIPPEYDFNELMEISYFDNGMRLSCQVKTYDQWEAITVEEVSSIIDDPRYQEFRLSGLEALIEYGRSRIL